MSRRAVISGVGVVAPTGRDAAAFWDALRTGVSGVRPIASFDASAFPTRIAAEAIDFDPSLHVAHRRAKHMDRSALLAVSAAVMAARDAGLAPAGAPLDRVGVIVGTSRGQYDFDYVADRWRADGRPAWRGITPEASLLGFPEACASQICMELQIHGPSLTLASGGASSLDAIGYAFRAVQRGELDVVVAGGTQAPVAPPLLHTFSLAGRLSRRNDEPARAARPFDRERDGMVLGEGAGMVIVEAYERAAARGARPYGEIAGYGASTDVRPADDRGDGREAARAVSAALTDARVDAEAIDCVSATGLSLPALDAAETRALERALGAHAAQVPVSAPSSMIGHLIGAAAGVELIAAVLGMRHGFVPPTINQEVPDPRCALDFVPNEARTAAVSTLLKTAFSLEGKNAALVVRRV